MESNIVYDTAFDMGAEACRSGQPDSSCPFNTKNVVNEFQARAWLDGYRVEEEVIAFEKGIDVGLDDLPTPCPYEEPRFFEGWIEGWVAAVCAQQRGAGRLH